MFHCGFETLWYHSLSCSSPHIHPSVTDTNVKLDGVISKYTFFIIHCEILVCLSPLQVFVLVFLLRSGLETAPLVYLANYVYLGY